MSPDDRNLTLAPDSEVVSFEKPEDVIEIAQKRIKWMDELISMSLARLRPGDVVSLEGRPYIVSDGCYKIARLFGLKIKYTGLPQKVEAQDKKGTYFYFVHAATVSLPNGDSIDVIGNCSSRDPFFGKVEGNWRPLEDVDVLDIMQKAQTNTDRKGIAKLLGLNNITWDDVAKYSKISQADCASFSFRKPAKGQTATSSLAKSDKVSAPPKANQEVRAASWPASTGLVPPKTQEYESPPEDIGQMADEAERRNAVYDSIQAASKAEGKWKGKTPTAIVKEVTGKVSLGICNDADMDKIEEALK